MLENFKDLYEVRKTVRFELKPSKVTQSFLEEQNIYYKPSNVLYRNKFENWFNYSKQIFEDNIKNTIEKIKDLYNILIKIKNLISNAKLSQIYINRWIFEIIDKKNFRRYKKSLSWWRSINLKEVSNNVSNEKINLIKNYLENNLSNINYLVDYIEKLWEKENSFSKNEIKKHIRKLSLELIRIYNFLEFFNLEESESKISENIKNIIKKKDFFNEIKSFYFISENLSSWILIRRFWLNEKSLNRRLPIDIKNDLKKEKEEFNINNNKKIELEKEKQKFIQEFDIKIKRDKFPELLNQEKIKYLRDKEEKTIEEEEFLEKINNDFKKLKELRNNDEEIKNITDKLNNIKKKVWNSKVKVNNLEKELENNLALSHYSKIIKRNIDNEELYYIVLIPIENKNILEDIKISFWDSQILKYNSLTFNALKKLAISQDGTMGIYWDKDSKKNKKTWVREWIIELYKELKEWKKLEELFKFKRYVQNLIEAYNRVFNIEFNFKKLNEATNLDCYIKEFNRQWYQISWKYINFDILERLEKERKIELYQIYTKDFFKDPKFFDINYSIKEQKEERKRRRKEKNVSWEKNLFSIYWENFIKDSEDKNINIRLNSDCGFYIKPKKDNIDEKWKSRQKRDKIIWSFNLLINPNKSIWELGDEKQNIESFNNFYKKNLKDFWVNKVFIWLDRWEYELITYCLVNEKWDCIKDKNWNYLIWELNCINSKWEFIKKENCIWKDKNWKIYKDLICDFLPTISQWKVNIIEWKKSFKFDNNRKQYYFNLNHGAKLYLIEWEKDKFNIINKNWEEIGLFDNNGNKVIDYYLIFKSEIYKRYISSYKNEINYQNIELKEVQLEDIQRMRWWYISNIIKQLNYWIKEYNWILILENLGKIQKEGNINKEDFINKTFWITIYQEIETLLNRKYNYVIFKDKDKNNNKFQLTPKISNITDIKNLEKSSNNVNLGNIIFIDEYLTSKKCPNCKWQLERIKKWWDNIFHNEKYPWNKWCEFSTKPENKNVYNVDFINSWDDLAAYNIAIQWIEYLKSLNNNKTK